MWVMDTSANKTFAFTIIAVIMLCIDVTRQSTIKTCGCWDGYLPERSENGSQCVGVQILHIMPCNMVRPPKCVCSGTISSILKDSTGTWCSSYSKGVELMRWPCENTEEWDEFFKKNTDSV